MADVPRPLDRLIGRSPEVTTTSAVMVFGLAVLVIGLVSVAGDPTWGFSWSGAADGLAGQLSVTLPAALLVAAATALDVVAGAIVLRFLGTPAFHGLSELILAGFAAAVVLDAAALFLLGGLGYFGRPELLGLQLAAIAAWAGLRRRYPLLAGRLSWRPRRPAAWWLPVLVVWSGPLIVQLASPAAPFFDVLPNHVAPVEHVRAFGSFGTLTTSPSPIYGPSRLLLGYVGLLGELSTVTGVQAILATAAFALPLTVIMALALRQTAGRLFGSGAAFWILLTFPLTFAFMRLPDTRGTVVAFPLALYVLGSIAAQLRGRASAASPDLALAAALGGCFLVHPLVGVIVAGAAVGLLILEPRRLARRLIPALGSAALIAVPQAGTMLGIGAPSWLGFAWLAAALPAAFGLDGLAARAVPAFERVSLPRPFVAGLQLALVLTAVAVSLVLARLRIPDQNDPAGYMFGNFIRITAGVVIGAVLGFRVWGRGWLVLGGAIAAGLAAWAASSLVGDADLSQQAIHYEVPKTVQYWLPVALALGTAGAVAALMRLRGLGAVRPILLGLFLIAILSPFPGPVISNIRIGEHRGAESLGLALRESERGYWDSFPDTRRIVNAAQMEVVERLRQEIEAGRLGPTTGVLHIDSSFQQWSSVPIGVFTGAMETSISLDPERSIHTEGGRLYGLDSLTAELASDYGYVVFEPAGMDQGLGAVIEAAGYRLIWSNSVALIYARAA